MKFSKLLSLAASACISVLVPALSHSDPAFGIDAPRLPNTELIITQPPPPNPTGFLLERVFPRVELKNTTAMATAPGDDSRIFFVDQEGRVLSMPWVEDPDPEEIVVCLDMQAEVCKFVEQGMIGMAFDPDFAQTGEIYLVYTPEIECGGWEGTPPLRLSRFRFADPQSNTILRESEEILLEQPKPGPVHHGGHVRFGPDGMLYFSIGDGGEESGRAQQYDDLYGSIIRIDVNSEPDPGLPYRIPADNPFYGQPGIRWEQYAKGLRNPFQFSFEPLTNLLITCDVGSDQFEEINIIRPGANYGWPLREGQTCRLGEDPAFCESPLYTDATISIPHAGGAYAVISGTTYTGTRLPELYGTFVFGSIYTGEVFATRVVDDGLAPHTLLAENNNLMLTVMAGLPDGEIYFCDYAATNDDGIFKNSGGGIYRLARSTAPPVGFPQKLSELPALHAAASGNGHNVDGVYLYEPSTQLWSDNTRKERYVALPGMEQAEWAPHDSYKFPDGTIFVKNFSLPLDERTPDESLQRIESRVFVRLDAQWYGVSYEWNSEQTDAFLLSSGKDRDFTITGADGEPFAYSWHYPSRTECFQCHTQASNSVLGFSNKWLNSELTYPQTGRVANQLATFGHIGLFNQELPAPVEELDKAPSSKDETAPFEDRAKAYLAANCSMCHRPGGGAPTAIDLRWETPFHQMGLYYSEPLRGTVGIEDPRLVYPQRPDDSVLWKRLASTNPAHRMPPLGTSRVDPHGSSLIRQWIEQLPAMESHGWMAY